jgi:PIN domain nuclease of toxin-antitoxin system
VTVLLDTHFLLWILTGAERLASFPWLDRYRPWGISPVSLLEIQFLSEVGRITVDAAAFGEAIRRDPRFIVDEVGLMALVDKALALSWTRDPFDRLLAAHSEARRVSFCSVDRYVRAEHRLLVDELR